MIMKKLTPRYRIWAMVRTASDKERQPKALHELDSLRMAIQRQVEASQPVIRQAVRAWKRAPRHFY